MTHYLANNHWVFEGAKQPSEKARKQACDYQNTLTKPPGSLGKLESIAISYCAWQGKIKPTLDKIRVRIFAADHGVCAKNISAFPQAVTGQMIENFAAGGAAICVLSESVDADFAVVNLGTVNGQPGNDLTRSSERDGETQTLVYNRYIAPETQDFSEQAAMTPQQLEAALNAGREQVENGEIDTFIAGEMGIGNTSSASALYCALLGISAEKAVGPGTGVDSAGVLRKQKVIQQALALHKPDHKPDSHDPATLLGLLGGFEIAAMCGAYIRCAQRGIPIVVDGFISTAAALVAAKINPDVSAWLIFSHRSAEPAHCLAIEYFNSEPLLDFGMRLGEGSGAALVVPLLKSAINLHNGMATFTGAGVDSAG